MFVVARFAPGKASQQADDDMDETSRRSTSHGVTSTANRTALEMASGVFGTSNPPCYIANSIRLWTWATSKLAIAKSVADKMSALSLGLNSISGKTPNYLPNYAEASTAFAARFSRTTSQPTLNRGLSQHVVYPASRDHGRNF